MIRTRNQFCAIISWKYFLETIFAVQISVKTGTKEKKKEKKNTQRGQETVTQLIQSAN